MTNLKHTASRLLCSRTAAILFAVAAVAAITLTLTPEPASAYSCGWPMPCR